MKSLLFAEHNIYSQTAATAYYNTKRAASKLIAI